MALDYVEYRLQFVSPLRVGDDHWAKTNRFPRIHADLLYRAVAHAYAQLYGSAVDEALPGGALEPRLRLSTAFPYTAALGALAPVPARWRAHAPQRLVPVAEPSSSSFVESPFDGEAAAPAPPWLVTRRVQASFDRIRSRRAQRFVTGEVRFADGAGLWLGVRFADAATDRARFEAALRFLGESGIGGGRSVGCGRFDVAAAHERTVPSEAPSSSLWWVLSRYRPSEREFAQGKLLAESSAAAIWDSWRRPGGADAAKNEEVRFLAEGSVIAGHDALDVETAGTAVTLARPGSEADARPMIRSGFLFALPMPPEPQATEAQKATTATTPPPSIKTVPPTKPSEEPAPAAPQAQRPAATPPPPPPAPAPAPMHPAEPKSVVLPGTEPPAKEQEEEEDKPEPPSDPTQ